MSEADTEQVIIAIRAIWLTCWKCGEPTIAVVGVHEIKQEPNIDQIAGMMKCDNPAALQFAQKLLGEAGMNLICKSLKVRASRTAGTAELSNGCQRCDALQGNFFIYHRELPEAKSIDDGEEVFIIAVQPVSLAEWKSLEAVSNKGNYITADEVVMKMTGNDNCYP